MQVSDGLLTDEETFHIVVNETVPVHNQILCPPVDMLVPQGQVAEQRLHAVSPDGNPVQFLLVSGPSYVTVSTTSPDPSNATGLVRATPSGSENVPRPSRLPRPTGSRPTHVASRSRWGLRPPCRISRSRFFRARPLFPTGHTPQSVAAGDLDGDGVLDWSRPISRGASPSCAEPVMVASSVATTIRCRESPSPSRSVT